MPHQTIGVFARRYGLSRGTLLYYDRTGLLKPAGVNAAGYRLYGDREAQRMTRINHFRQAGLSLKVIREILDASEGDAVSLALEQRLADLNREVGRLRAQQRLVVELLRRQGHAARNPEVDVGQWVAMLTEAGVDEPGLWRWHAAFERENPHAHEVFLQGLGLSPGEIAEIRRESRTSESVSSDTTTRRVGRRSTREAKRGG